LGKIYNPDNAGKQRNRLCREVLFSLRELMRQSEPDDMSKDLAAFIAQALVAIFQTVDVSVTAWEKRGYWVKADRFRLEWEWADVVGKRMCEAVVNGDWALIAELGVQTAQKMRQIKLPKKPRIGTPWVGAMRKLKESGD